MQENIGKCRWMTKTVGSSKKVGPENAGPKSGYAELNSRQHALIFPPAYPVTPGRPRNGIVCCCLLGTALQRDFCTVYLTAKFDRPTFSCSEVIVRTNKQTPLKTSTSLRYATPVGNDGSHV